MNIDQLIKNSGGLHACLDHFGWQGGTIHQVKQETIKRLHASNFVIGKDGTIYKLSLKK